MFHFHQLLARALQSKVSWPGLRRPNEGGSQSDGHAPASASYSPIVILSLSHILPVHL